MCLLWALDPKPFAAMRLIQKLQKKAQERLRLPRTPQIETLSDLKQDSLDLEASQMVLRAALLLAKLARSRCIQEVDVRWR